MAANTMGSMTVDQLGTFVKTYTKKSMEVIRQGIDNSGLLGGAFPTSTLSTPKLEVRWTHGNPGRMNVALDAPVEQTNWAYKATSKDLTFDKFSFMVTDSATDMIAAGNMAADGIRYAMKFFADVEDYQKVTELKAKNNSNCTAAAGGYWNGDTADMEGDIIGGIETVVKYSGIKPDKVQWGVLYPSKVLKGVEQLDLIHNVQQNIKTYLKSVFPIEFYAYTPPMNAAGSQYIDVLNNTSSDALGTSALLFVKGQDTMKSGTYSVQTMTETTRIHDVGYVTTLRHSSASLAIPLYDDSTYTTPLIYEITAVSA